MKHQRVIGVLLLTGAVGCASADERPDPPPSTTTDSEPATTRYRLGDRVTYLYRGAHLGQAVTLTERVVFQQGNTLHIKVVLQKGAETKAWLQVLTDTPDNQRNNIVDELYALDGDRQTPLNAKDPKTLMGLYAWTLPPSLKPTGDKTSEPVQARLGSQWFSCEQSIMPVEVDGERATMRTSQCNDFLWTHGPASLVTDSGALLWSTSVVAQSRHPGEPPMDVTGWEGFFSPSVVAEPTWLLRRGIPLRPATLEGVRGRTVKLVLDDGMRSAPEEELIKRHRATCSEETVRVWNEERCAGLEARECRDGTCAYHHYGNCSGFLLEEDLVLTAAHCLAGLVDDAERRKGSAVLIPMGPGEPPKRSGLDAITVAKKDFSHHWVAVTEPEAVDVATAHLLHAEKLPKWEVAPLPAEGDVVFIHGYPRVEGRSPEAQAARGYSLSAGVPTFSFGKVADRNDSGDAFCNIDGNQEHWQLSEECPVGEVTFQGEKTWRGPITQDPFLGTWDSCNGYSGAPIFDAGGRLVGVNSTVMSPHSPQEKYSTVMFQVAIPAEKALPALGLSAR